MMTGMAVNTYGAKLVAGRLRVAGNVGYEIQTLLCAYVQGCADAQVCGYKQWDNRTMVSRTKGQWNNGTMGQRAIGCVGIASSCI